MKAQKSDRLLLIAFSWCPRGGVGSRRWSKFAKYLTRKGWRVDVITASYPIRDKVNWCKDISNNPSIVSYPTKSGYPSYLLRPRRNFLVKVADRVLNYLTHNIDYAQRWSPHMRRQCSKLLRQHSYRAVVMTVGPFTPLIDFHKLKEQHPDNYFILDYRDPWSYRHDQVSRTSKRSLMEMEARAVAAADAVWVTTQEHKEAYALLFPGIAEKIYVLTNGFDPEDFPEIATVKRNTNQWIAVHPGSLFGERFDTLLMLVWGLVKTDSPILKEKFRIHVYTSSQLLTRKIPRELAEAFDHYVVSKEAISPSEMMSVLATAKFGLTLDISEHHLTIPSKTFDYIGLGIKLILLGPDGAIPNEIKEAGHYVAPINDDSISSLLQKIVAQETGGEPLEKNAHLIKKYGLNNLQQELLRLLPE
ncbi:MAG: glycosyltransferase [Lewinella sp.]|nr:glycosyltransferase [Lewinella sp.]